jgi:uncharacterized protein (TIGR02594 family)
LTTFIELLTTLPAALPWLDLLLVFVGMLALCWKLASGQHDLSTLLAQALARTAPLLGAPQLTPQPALPGATPAPAPAAPVPQPAPPPAPLPTPKPTGPFAGAPPWFQWAYMEVGVHEIGNNQGLQRYIDLAHTGAEGEPWCAIFANAALEAPAFQDNTPKTFVPGSRSPSSQSFLTDANFIKLAGPALGCLCVFWRGSQASGLGHVGFYRGEDATRLWVLGGNENDMVQIEAMAKSSATFGLRGYYWPKSVALPEIKPIIMPSGSPTSIQTHTGAVPVAKPIAASPDGVHTNIVATYFGGQTSAYGGAINDNSPGVALPYRFDAAFRSAHKVRVTGVKNGASTDCDIIDIGPWNINDPYWQNGTRPEAESGFDLGQVSHGVPRKTNQAGIDLTLAAATACGIDGKGLVNWQFIDNSTPNVV